MGNVMFMRKGEVHTAPVGGLPLSSLVEGQIVMIPEDGVLTPFYLAKHDYESALNGLGRTLMVRETVPDTTLPFNEAGTNLYPNREIDNWVNDYFTDGTYLTRFSENLLELMGYVKIYYTVGNGNSTIKTMERRAFALSAVELGATETSTINAEGTVLPIADLLKIAYKGTTPVYQWTRSPHLTDNTKAWGYTSAGSLSSAAVTTKRYVRPAFTLPSDMLTEVNDDGTVTLKV